MKKFGGKPSDYSGNLCSRVGRVDGKKYVKVCEWVMKTPEDGVAKVPMSIIVSNDDFKIMEPDYIISIGTRKFAVSDIPLAVNIDTDGNRGYKEVPTKKTVFGSYLKDDKGIPRIKILSSDEVGAMDVEDNIIGNIELINSSFVSKVNHKTVIASLLSQTHVKLLAGILAENYYLSDIKAEETIEDLSKRLNKLKK
ncbi:MAG: hypothetical protein LBL47_01560 [Lactobacillus sp.]|nr:hypothetical protein [Lactobacillus sp.]